MYGPYSTGGFRAMSSPVSRLCLLQDRFLLLAAGPSRVWRTLRSQWHGYVEGWARHPYSWSKFDGLLVMTHVWKRTWLFHYVFQRRFEKTKDLLAARC